LVEDVLDNYQPLGAHGQAVHGNYLQIQEAVRRRLGQRSANLFARPVRDGKDKVMRWYTEFPGKPERWYDLSPADQTQRSLELHAMRAEFAGFIRQLRDSNTPDGTGSKAFANVLEQALFVPDDRHVFFVGEQPVLSFWGFRGQNSQPFEALSIARPAPISAPTPPGAIPSPERQRRSFFSWLWWLLGMLTILALALLALYFCAPQVLAPAIQFGNLTGVLPNAQLTLPDGRILLPDGRIQLPNAAIGLPSGGISGGGASLIPGGSWPAPFGVIHLESKIDH
jgi:hypothetical protein